MNEISAAEAHLRTIRSLMEKAAIYRAISVPTAFTGGILSLIAAAVEMTQKLSPLQFKLLWLTALLITTIANVFFIWQSARKRSDPFISSGMKQALQSLLPPLGVGGVLTFGAGGTPETWSALWMIFYGLSLLATQHFAPRTLVALGFLFLISGLFCWIAIFFLSSTLHIRSDWMMGVTFGGYHLLYAIRVQAMIRKDREIR